MFGFLFLILAFVFVLIGLGSYRKRRQQQQHTQTLYHKNNPQVNNPNGQGYYGNPQSPNAPPPMYQSQGLGAMEAGIISAPPPAYSRSGQKAEYDQPELYTYNAPNAPPAPKAGSKSGFRGWIRGG